MIAYIARTRVSQVVLVDVQVSGGLSLEERRPGILILVLTCGLSASSRRLYPWFLTHVLSMKFLFERTLLGAGHEISLHQEWTGCQESRLLCLQVLLLRVYISKVLIRHDLLRRVRPRVRVLLP